LADIIPHHTVEALETKKAGQPKMLQTLKRRWTKEAVRMQFARGCG
jgi:hypothetical protein